MRLGTDLIDSTNTRLDDWAMHRGALAELDAFLVRECPEVIVETGSGVSTLLLARYARATGATVVTLEHQGRYFERTGDWLIEEGLRDYVDLRYAPLIDTVDGPWYATTLPDNIDFALVDGPPESTGGRKRVFYELYPNLRPDGRWHVWLDDAHRPAEAAAMAEWASNYHGVSARMLNIGRGMGQLKGSAPGHDDRSRWPGKFEAEDVAVTILTGRRPDLLRRQLASLGIFAPGLLDTARVHILANGGDTTTVGLVSSLANGHANISHTVPGMSGMWKIGPATSHLAEWARRSGATYWLHLEDDWEIVTAHPGWLDEARNILRADADIHQVRLRHITEPVLKQHMHTKLPITWRTADDPTADHLHSAAHWTFNPSLVRTFDIPQVFPAAGEKQAIQAAHRYMLDRKIAQHAPGVFRHIGGTDSLADKTKGR